MRLLLSQKNTLFQLIENNEYFSPSNFELNENNDQRVTTRLLFKKSEFQFAMTRSEMHQDSIHISHWPGNTQIRDSYLVAGWEGCFAAFRSWIGYLHREVTSPNLWERFQSSISDLQLTNETNNSKFSHSEYIELSTKMQQLIDAIPTINLATIRLSTTFFEPTLCVA